MNKKIVDSLQDITNKVVIVRVDFNVPLIDGNVTDTNRIVEALPTIKYLQKREAKIVLLSHLGKVNHKDPEKKKKDMAKNDMKLVAPSVKKYLKSNFLYCPHTKGKEVEAMIKEMKPKQVLLLQNTRYEDGEEKNDAKLAKYWASLADAFVMDAFGSAHRAHASTVGIPSAMKLDHKPTALGYLVEKEVSALSKCVEASIHPYVAILGGSKVAEKIHVIEALLRKADLVILGGSIAHTFMKARGNKVGNSFVEDDQLDFARKCLSEGKDKILLPIDQVIAESIDDPKDIRNTLSENITDGFIGLDIGIRTVYMYKAALADAKMVFWNGPMGMFENDWFAKGTAGICQGITDVKGIFSVVGGGDSASAVAQFGYKDKFSHVSTGGGASLEMIQNDGHLPGIDVIDDA